MSYKQQFLRGVRLESSSNKVQSCLDRLHHKYAAKAVDSQPKLESNRPQLSLAGFRLPSYLEDLGIFCVGSPGSGKSQAIAKLIQELQQRDDYRIVCLDRTLDSPKGYRSAYRFNAGNPRNALSRNGEFTASFYREGKDLLFNPVDERSVGWCHSSESASVETIASGIIPLDTLSDPFWPVSARNFLSEIYQRAETNAHVWEAVSLLSIEELKSLLQDSMFNKYFDSEKTLASIVASATSDARFYGQLPDKEEKIDLWHWAESGNRRSLFLPLFEKDAQLFKPLYSMVLELIILGLLSNVEREVKTAIIIDELGALQPISSLSRLLAEGRKSKATPILATQTVAQIDKLYDRNERQILLQGTATKLILNCRDPDSAVTMAQIIGTQEVLEEYRHSQGIMATVRDRYAVMPSEIQNLPPLSGYLMFGSDVPVVRGEITPVDYPVIAPRLVPSSSRSPELVEPVNDSQLEW